MFRDIEDYEGLYQVSDQGKVKSLHGKREIILKGCISRSGYLMVGLHKNNHLKTCCVHSLVAHAFPEICGEYFEGAEINHKDENKTNNAASNLEFVDVKTNRNYGTRNERMRAKLTNNTRESKPIYQYTLEGELVKEYPSAHEVERQTGWSYGAVSRCARGECNKAYNYIWRY